MPSILSVVKYASRRAAKNPLFSAVVLITLTLGIGASTAIFALAYGLLRPLPFEDSQRLVALWEGQTREGLEKMHVSPPNFEDWSAENLVFEEMAALYTDTFNLTGDDVAERILGASVSPSFFRTFGVPITIGRDFVAGEDESSAPDVVLLSDALWQSRYGGSTQILGETVRINGAPRTVIGVVPPGLEYPRRAKVWLPLRFEDMNQRRDARALEVVARLEPGVGVSRAQEAMDTLAARLAAEYPESNEGWVVTVVPLLDELVGDTRPALWVLMAAVALLLLITCVNVASLLLARGLERAREIAVRQAFGASRRSITGQLLAENLVLAVVAGALGVVLAWGLLRLFAPMIPSSVMAVRQIEIDGVILAFALLLGVATTLVFGLFPALRASRGDLADTLKQGGRSSSDGAHLLLRNGLVVAEFALTFALLVTTLLVGRGFVRLVQADPGFVPDHVLTARVGLDPARYANPLMINAFFDGLLERVSGLPGVKMAASVDALPLTGSTEGTVFLPQGWPMPDPGEQPVTRLTVASHDYFQTLGIPLLQGRDFELTDVSIDPNCECVASETVPIVVINETMARKYWPGQDPVGQRMKLGDLESDLLFEIVGVARDVRYDGLDATILPRTYVFDGQFPVTTMSLAVRTSGDPTGLAGAVRRELRELDPELPAYGIRTLEDLIDRSVARPRLIVSLMGVFTLLALILSTVGLYGVIRTNVAQRTKEFGVHIALGSKRRTLVWMVLRRALLIGALGAVVGTVLAFALNRAVASLLSGVGEGEPGTFVMAGGLLAAVTLLGSLLPALRATRLDPVEALRIE